MKLWGPDKMSSLRINVATLLVQQIFLCTQYEKSTRTCTPTSTHTRTDAHFKFEVPAEDEPSLMCQQQHTHPKFDRF